MVLDLSAKYIRLAYYLRSRGTHDTANKQLQFVRVEPHPQGAVVVASNGWSMFIAIDRDGECREPANLDISTAMHWQMKPDRTAMRVRANKSALSLRMPGERPSFHDDCCIASDSSYPNWRTPVPHDLLTLRVHFPATLNGELLSMIGSMGNDYPALKEIAFLGHDSSEPMNCIAWFHAMPEIMLLAAPLTFQKKRGPEPTADWIAPFTQVGQRVDDDL